jgi:hypothetical protein
VRHELGKLPEEQFLAIVDPEMEKGLIIKPVEIQDQLLMLRKNSKQ